jgi:hypothetical protein
MNQIQTPAVSSPSRLLEDSQSDVHSPWNQSRDVYQSKNLYIRSPLATKFILCHCEKRETYSTANLPQDPEVLTELDELAALWADISLHGKNISNFYRW